MIKIYISTLSLVNLMFKVFKIPGELNPADLGTKNLHGNDIRKQLSMIHHRVPT